jgi:hypothetical protein
MMVIQATASVVIGTLIEAGYAFDYVYRSFSVGLVAIFAVLLGLYLLGHLPEGTR